jgi:hypothetical protein
VTDDSRPTRLRAADLAVRVGVPVAVFAVVLAVFLGERAAVDHELQLLAPERAAPGHPLALRAFLFERLQAVDGPHLASVPVEVRLLDGNGQVRAQTTLTPSPAGGSEGDLTVPADLRGAVTLEALARAEGEPLASARAALELRADAPPLPLAGRLATELQQLSLGPVRGESAPSALDVRIDGAACIPERACRVLVHVGEPAAAVHLEPSASVTPGPPAAPSAGLVELTAVVHGPEARTELVATRDGAEVARRSVQLPVALATPAVMLASRHVPAGAPVRLAVNVLGDPPAVVVDAYRDGQWIHATSIAPSEDAQPLPRLLAPGVWRLQVHADPFVADRAAVRWLVVGSEGEAAVEALTVGLAESPPPTGPVALQQAWLASPSEASMHPLPAGVSGLAADLERLEARRARLRYAAVVALGLGLIVAGVLFLRRGLEAAGEAQRVMDATGDPVLTSRRHRRRTLLSALLIVATVLLAFVGAAALIVARAHLLD